MLELCTRGQQTAELTFRYLLVITLLIKLHHLRDFVAIAQARSVRGAARSLGLAQPALTRSLRELEQHLGAQLLDRHSRGVALTPHGERFLLRANAAMEEVRRGTEELQQLGGSLQGAVTAALSSAAMLALLPKAFSNFRADCPDVRLRLMEGAFPALEPRLRDGTLDFFVGPRPERLDRQAFQVETWFENQRRIVVRKGHPLAGVQSLRDLVDADWVLTGLRERFEQELEEHFNAHDLPVPRLLTRVDSMLGMLSLVTSTDAIALLPRQVCDSPMFAPLITVVAVREPVGAPDIVLITRAGMPLTPAAERLATLLRRAA